MYEDITNIAIEDYLALLMPPRPEIFDELEKRARAHGLPLLGPVEGQFLYLLAKSAGAREAYGTGRSHSRGPALARSAGRRHAAPSQQPRGRLRAGRHPLPGFGKH